MRADECLFLVESGRAADITAMTGFDPMVFGSLTNRRISTDRAMEA
jgi:hypothetical protein